MTDQYAAGMRIPTEAMLIAARDWSKAKYGTPIGDDAAIGCWQAMLAAIPAPAPATDGRDVEAVARDGDAALLDFLLTERPQVASLFDGAPNIRDMCFGAFELAKKSPDSDWVHDVMPVVDRTLHSIAARRNQRLAALDQSRGGR